MNKKTLFTIAGLTVAMTMQAQQVSESQALERAQAFMNSKAQTMTAGRRNARQREAQQLTLASKCNAYYVYNAGDNDGFVIVSGDERMGTILGYSTEGRFDQQLVPSNMRAWLKGYEETVSNEQLVTSLADRYKIMSLQGKAAVAPLIKTKWSQDWPYNLQTPEVNGLHCKTGCVATSMAMLMNYWQHPKTTAKDIPAWFGLAKVPAGTTIDWGNMSDYYSDNEWWSYFVDVEDNYYNELYPYTTEEQQQAVAQLMKLCGMAVQMNYGTDESSAQDIAPLEALKNYFDYKNEMQFLQQDNYSIENWETIIYHELEQNRPVLYGGIADDMAFQGGHSFIVDGYDGNGFFHINWGVSSGMLHAYYTLSAQRFFKQTSAIVGIQPTVGGTIANVPTVGAYTTDAQCLTLTAVTTDGTVWANQTLPGCGNVILTLKNNGNQLFKGPITVVAQGEDGMFGVDNVLAEVPAGGTAQVLVPYYEFMFDYGNNIIHVADYATNSYINGAFPITVERQRIPDLNIEYTLDGVDDKGLIMYGKPITLRYKISSQWAGDPTLKARLRLSDLPMGEELRELGTIQYGKTIEGSVRIDAPAGDQPSDYFTFSLVPRVEFYTDTQTTEYLNYFYQNGTQEGNSLTVVYCKKKPHFAAKPVKVELEKLTGFNVDQRPRPAGYYVLGHNGFVGFDGLWMKDEMPDLYEPKEQRAWQDYLEGVTFYTGILRCGDTTKKHLGVFDCPSDMPYAAGSITKTLGGKTVYFPCNMNGMKEAAERGLYKNEVGEFLPYDDWYLSLLYSGGGVMVNDFFDDCYLYYYPIVDSVEGDVNGDGTVNMADIAAIITAIAAPPLPGASSPGAADVNGDGVVNMADIITVISIMASPTNPG